MKIMNLLKIHPGLLTAYRLKESYIIFNKSNNLPNATLASIHDFYHLFLSSNIPKFLPIVSALGNWDKKIANSFYIYNGRRIYSGIAKSINSTISTISTIIFNYKDIRNNEGRKKRIMYVVKKTLFLSKFYNLIFY